MAKTSLAAITLSTSSVIKGNNVGIFSRLLNLTAKKIRVQIEVYDTPPSGDVVSIATFVVRLNANEAKLLSIVYVTKGDAVNGTHVITVASLIGNNDDASVTANLTVTAS